MLHIVVKAVQMDSENNIRKLAIHKLFFQGKLSKDELEQYLNQLGSGELNESFPDFYEVEQFIENNPQPKLNTNVKRMNRFSWFVAASVILICFLAISLSIWKTVNKKALEKRIHKMYFFKPTSGALTLLRLFDPTATF